ncbi:hypothetical protein B0T10DRAFT_486942 [Thelonectria olida]|uniref:Uncharacterized protein n=1 Tax=Thelonectria olida TaxID=1576542 RepID=A0A9P8W757_9HYPO|nr:hypothetical protein B0T10DRAFT_486942 [Thelonectria olida]
MTSICNYSHPELQLHNGLVHHKTGELFPYNREFYDRVSGLYGPGAIYCWHLLLASLVINWSFYPRDKDGFQRPGVTNDFLGVMAFPTFAATDGLIHSIKLWGTKHRALAFFCLRFPATELNGLAKFNHTQLDLNHIPPDVLDLGQRVVDLTGPITVCYTFAAVFVILVFLMVTDALEQFHWQPTRWAALLASASYGYVLFVLLMFHLSIGDIFVSFIIALYEALLPFGFFVLFGSSVLIGVAAIGWVAIFVESIIKRDKKELWECAKGFLAVAVGACFPGALIFFSSHNRARLVPDLAISVTERDQMATLIVGITTLCFTLFDVWRRVVVGSATKPSGANEAEMQPLSTEQV